MATFHPLDYVSLVRRRKWWLIAPAVVCIVGSVLLAYFLPRVYRSAATITAASPSVSADLLKQAGPLTRDDRVRAISQQLLSRAVLEQVVREERLAPDGDVNAAVDRLLQPNRIKVEPMQLLKQVASRDGPTLDAFLLSYGGATPPEAQRVTDTLARIFVEASSRSREARAEDTSAFVNAQLAASRRRLDAIEVCARPRRPTWAACPSRRNRTSAWLLECGSSSNRQRSRSVVSRTGSR
jgi:succinoglycan biosynthesis transport protein ExoP